MFAAHSPLAPSEDYSPDPTLTPQMHRVITNLASGLTITQAAEAEKIHRNTVGNWRRTVPPFARELEYALRERALYWHEQATTLAPLAVQTLSDILTNPDASLSLKLRASLAVLKMSTETEPKTLSFLEARITEIEARSGQVLRFKQQIKQQAHNDAQSCTTSLENQPVPAVQTPNMQNRAQSCTTPAPAARPQPIRVDPQPGRNTPCPCKSGLKYKRCCANKPKTSAAAL